MVVDIPTPAEYRAAGVNLIFLAWQIAMQSARDHEEAVAYSDGFSEEDIAEATAVYWARSQPALGNAFSLVQQSMEIGLKAKIAEVSPYLLIARDPKDWPRGVDAGPVPFSDFRSVDAADLVKVHNTFAAKPLDEAFRSFWDEVRRERNRLMHALAPRAYDPWILVRHILEAVEALYNDIRWPQRLLDMEADDKLSGFGIGVDAERNTIMAQIDRAIENLKPAEALRFFGFNKKQHAYVCPTCWRAADRDWQETWPRLAQLKTKSPTETHLHCVLCDGDCEVERIDCVHDHCPGNVIHEETCLTCTWNQDNPQAFASGLRLEEETPLTRYSFTFNRRSSACIDDGYFADDAAAIEHARRAMSAPHLQDWEGVEVHPPSFGRQAPRLGFWRRQETALIWNPGDGEPLWMERMPRTGLPTSGTSERD